MIQDLPHVEYKKKRKTGYSQQEYDKCVAANLEIERKYLESQKDQEINLTELMQNS